MTSANQADLDAQEDRTSRAAATHDQRARLLAAAQDVFAANGYHAAAMDEIAKRAEVSKPVLYQHFPGKLKLYLALLETHVDELVAQVRVVIESTTDENLRVQTVVVAFFDFAGVEGQAFRMVSEPDPLGGSAVPETVERAWQNTFGSVAEIITAETPIGPDLIGMLSAGLAGTAVDIARWGMHSNSQVSREVDDLVIELMWRGVTGLLPAPLELDRLHSLAQVGDLQLIQYPVRGSPTAPTGSHTLPISIYLESAANATAVEQAVRELLDATGFKIGEIKPPVIGSWLRLMLARSKKTLTSAEMVDAMTRIERAVEMQVLHKPQAEIDSAQAEAVAKLITALSGDPNAFIQIGSVFLIKIDGVIVVRNLSQRELAFLQRNSRILDSPREILRALEEFAQNESSPEKPTAADSSARITVGGPDDR